MQVKTEPSGIKIELLKGNKGWLSSLLFPLLPIVKYENDIDRVDRLIDQSDRYIESSGRSLQT